MQIKPRSIRHHPQLISGHIANTLRIFNRFNRGFFRSIRELRQQYPGRIVSRAGLISLRLEYRNNKYYAGVFSTELRQIKHRFLKD